MGYPDSVLEPSLELRRDIARDIRRYKHDVVIVGSPTRDTEAGYYVGHPDHFAAGEAALSAVFPTARDRMTFPELLEEGLEPHKVREVWVAGGGDHSDQCVDVEAHRDTAIKALEVRRDAAQKKILGTRKDLQSATDFVALNRVLKDQGRTLATYDRLSKDSPVRRLIFDGVSDLLLEARRYEDVLEMPGVEGGFAQ